MRRREIKEFATVTFFILLKDLKGRTCLYHAEGRYISWQMVSQRAQFPDSEHCHPQCLSLHFVCTLQSLLFTSYNVPQCAALRGRHWGLAFSPTPQGPSGESSSSVSKSSSGSWGCLGLAVSFYQPWGRFCVVPILPPGYSPLFTDDYRLYPTLTSSPIYK